MDDYMSGDETVAIFDESVKPEDLNVSPVIHVGSFVSKWESVLDTVDYLPNAVNPDHEMLSDLLTANKDIVKELEGVCDPSALEAKMPVKKALDKMDLEEAIPAAKGHRLSTLQLRLDNLKNTKLKAMHTVSVVRGRFRSNRSTYDLEYHHVSKPGNEKHIVQPLTLLQISMFKPHLISGKDRDSKVKMMFDRELLLLSTQKLTDIKKMLTCVTDEAVLTEECSECPDLPQTQRGKDVFKSSFFFIENTFYVDHSHPSCKDLSEPIREWASAGRLGVSSDMQTEKMEDVVLDDLNIRLGYPYLYCHQGECEHVFLFTDMRLMHDKDNKDLRSYPMMINKCEARRIHCIVCTLFTAKWVTQEDSFSPVDPSFFCDKCFRLLHYDANGKKLGSFKAWPYADANIFS